MKGDKVIFFSIGSFAFGVVAGLAFGCYLDQKYVLYFCPRCRKLKCAYEKLANTDWQDTAAMLLETWELAARLQNEVESDEAFRELFKRIDENWIEANRKAKQ
jgi:hypothetical protein